ncbi:MAG: ACP S-malonyltransferase [Gammaproteobacteria bacterium]|nr:ACP S-malonyltransferase [Gammaproteobacteria bacterium]
MALGIVFPGQGSQSVGMLDELSRDHPQMKETFTEASDVLGYDLWHLVINGPAAELNRTEKTQPAMLAAGVAVWRIWLKRGGQVPAMVAGHSLGEYTALVCADALSFEDALLLVADRGAYMQNAVPDGTGAMAAILGLDDEKVIDVCEQAAQGEVVAPANFNSPGQVVIAGHIQAVQRALETARASGAKRAVMLSVSVPSHCELMKPAADKLAGDLKNTEIKLPSIPVIHNVDAETKTDPDSIRSALVEQLYRPVQWTTCVRALAGKGMVKLVECGPGKVLSGLNKRIDRSLECLATSGPADLEKTLSSLRGELA